MNDPTDLDGAQPFVSWIHDLPAGWVAILFLLLMGLGLWAALRALPLRRLVSALKSAPLVAIDSAPEGLVKVSGQAFPGQVTPEGYATPKHVWSQTRKSDLRSSPSLRTTSTYSIAPILIRDDTAQCLIDPLQATVLPTHSTTSEERHIFDESTYRSAQIIRTGDKVFAIGVLGQAKKRAGAGDMARCTLRPSRDGVLLLSGQSETRTLLRMQWRFWWRASVAFFCILLALWGFIRHLDPYPELPLTAYLHALVNYPWVTGPGFQPGN